MRDGKHFSRLSLLLVAMILQAGILVCLFLGVRFFSHTMFSLRSNTPLMIAFTYTLGGPIFSFFQWRFGPKNNQLFAENLAWQVLFMLLCSISILSALDIWGV